MRVTYKIMLGLTVFGFIAASNTASAQNAVNFPAATGKTTLTISGGGYWHQDVLEAGEYPVLSPNDNSGLQLADGRYNYELRSMPEASKTGRMQGGERPSSNSQGKGQAQSVKVISGSFDIIGGELTTR